MKRKKSAAWSKKHKQKYCFYPKSSWKFRKLTLELPISPESSEVHVFLPTCYFEGCTCSTRVYYILDDTCAPVIGWDLMTQLNMHLDCGTGQVHLTEEAQGSVGSKRSSSSWDVSCSVGQLPSSMDSIQTSESQQHPSTTLPPVVSHFIEHHPKLVSEDIGTFLGFEHHIKLAPDAVPVEILAKYRSDICARDYNHRPSCGTFINNE